MFLVLKKRLLVPGIVHKPTNFTAVLLTIFELDY